MHSFSLFQKINAKNAFRLHLIDYMTDLVKKKAMNNFQVASSTLDASAKIYAGRVDAVHSETYKMLGSLGRGAEKQGVTRKG
jgi:condensin complex subunit 2